jgi:hypothetical protein
MIDPNRLIAFYRRCRLDHQLAFYEGRSTEFGSAASQLAMVSAAVLALTSLVSVLAAAKTGGDAVTILTIALPAVSTALAGYGALYAFEQQRKLYRDAVRALRDADRVEPADPAAYAETIEAIFANEVAQWGQIVGEIKPTGTGG